MAPWEPPEELNLADWLLWERLREGRGDAVALRLPSGPATYREVCDLAARYASVLGDLGVDQEDRVLLGLRDGADYVGALFGTLALGGVVVMVNPDLAADALRRLYAYVRPRVAVVDGGVATTFGDAAGSGRWPRRILVAGDGGGGETGPRYPRFAEAAPAEAPELEPVPTHRDDPAVWLFSGGTTGRPKAVVQTHGSFANTTELYARRAMGYREGDVTMSVPKLFFGYATGSNLFFPFSVGASACLFPEHPTPEVLFARIAEHRPTILVNVPTMVQKMVAHPDAARQDLSSLRFATSAGEALSPALYARWKETFGVELLDGLGTAEMWHIFVTNTPERVRPGTLGWPVPGFDVRVRDEHGTDLPAGEVGRLWVRGSSRAVAYWQNMPQTMEAFRGEWYVSGDLVREDEAGAIVYCGRADDVLKVAGKWFVPGELETVLAAHPEVREAAVVGVETEDGLTKPVGFVVADPRPGLESDLKEWVLERLAAYKHPRRVYACDSLPRTHLGKVDRGALRARAAGRSEGEES